MPGLAKTFDDNKTPARTVRGICNSETTREEVLDFARKVDSRVDIFGWRDLRLDTKNGNWSIIIHTD